MKIQLAVPVLFYNVKKTFRPCFSTNPAGVRDTEMSVPSKKGQVDRNPDVDGHTERNRRRSCRGSASSLGLVDHLIWKLTCLPFFVRAQIVRLQIPVLPLSRSIGSVVSVLFVPEGSVADPYVFEPPGSGSILRCTDPDPSIIEQK